VASETRSPWRYKYISQNRGDREKLFFWLIRSRWEITAPVVNCAQTEGQSSLASIGGPNLGMRLSQDNHRTTRLLERSRWMGYGIQLVKIKDRGRGGGADKRCCGSIRASHAHMHTFLNPYLHGIIFAPPWASTDMREGRKRGGEGFEK
jgi:hypothetical protein